MANPVASQVHSIEQAWHKSAAAEALEAGCKKMFPAGLTFSKRAVCCAAFNQELDKGKQPSLFFPVRAEIFPPKGMESILRAENFFRTQGTACGAPTLNPGWASP